MRNPYRQSEALQGAKRAGGLSAIAVVAVLVATLWPLNPFPRNRISWLPGMNGLRFEKASLVVGADSLNPPQTSGRESYTVELLVRPASVKSSNTILAFYHPNRVRQFQLRQWFEDLIVTHDARVDSDETLTIKFDVTDAFDPGKLVFIALSSGPNGTTVYLDDQPGQVFPRFRITRDELSGEIILGTSPAQYYPWSGEVRGLAVYAKEITSQEALQHYHGWIDRNGHPPDLTAAIARYTFSEAAGTEVHNEVSSGPNLQIPPTFSVPHKRLLLSPAQEFRHNWHYIRDAVTNVAGFLPLGVIVCSYLAWTRTSWKAILTAVFFCGILSFTIEIAQYYIPRRDSGITDIITNTLGAAAGAVLVQSSLVRELIQRVGLIPAGQNGIQGIE
jgi:VanZ family protein